jgi:uncharacterized protein YkwD
MMRFMVFISVLILLAACTTSPKGVAPQAVSLDRANAVSLSKAALPTSTSTPIPTAQPTQTPDVNVISTPTAAPSPTLAAAITSVPTETVVPTTTIVPTATVVPTTTPTAEPGEVSTTEPTQILQAQDCIDKAAFSADVTIPDGTTFSAGDTFTKTWKVRNEGTCIWKGYNLIYVSGEVMNAPISNPIQEVAPGEFAEISLELQAPPRGGQHTGYWEFMNAAGKTFGVGSAGEGLLWLKINVDFPTVTPVVDSSTPDGSPTDTPSGSCAYTLNSDYESQILSLINDVRAQNGLNPLTLDSKLQAAALAHSLDMACNNYVNHTGSDGSTWYDRVKAQGFRNYHTARENIYVGNPAFGGDAQGAFDWWMNSDIHRKTILLPNITVIGISYVFTSTSTYGGYYTADFARP